MQLKFKRLHPNAVLPSHKNTGDAGMDLTACKIRKDIDDLETHYYGVSIEIPEGHVGLIFPRSSIRNYDVRLSNAVGVIDSGYRGELMAVFDIKEGLRLEYKAGERTAQLVVIPYCHCNTEWADELSDTERGTGGYGSTGQ
jgi:dUTP pyrophosphatase